nr:serine/threonine-protein kinase ULK4-like [Neomonachus schauinslandi]
MGPVVHQQQCALALSPSAKGAGPLPFLYLRDCCSPGKGFGLCLMSSDEPWKNIKPGIDMITFNLERSTGNHLWEKHILEHFEMVFRVSTYGKQNTASTYQDVPVLIPETLRLPSVALCAVGDAFSDELGCLSYPAAEAHAECLSSGAVVGGSSYDGNCDLLQEHQENILGNTMQSVIALLNNLVACKDSNMKLLYEQGLVRHVCDLFTETATLCLDMDNKNNNEMAAALLFSLLDILHGMLTYTSSVVRLALQKSGSGGDTQAAEDLLLLSKPLTDLISLLIPLGFLNFVRRVDDSMPSRYGMGMGEGLKGCTFQIENILIGIKDHWKFGSLKLPNEDPEIFEVSSKCLSILVQLYGGENPDSLSPENAENFADLLTSKEDPKEQKLLLKILRRMVTSNKKHLESLKDASSLLQALEWLAPAGGSSADSVVASLALEILQAARH